MKLNFRKWLFFFFSTLGIGGITVVNIGLLLDLAGISVLSPDLTELLLVYLWLFVVGLTFSTISQMAFFAYLLGHRLFQSLLKSVVLWRNVQIVLILVVFFDLVYFRYLFFQEGNEGWAGYLILPAVLLTASLPVAYVKARETNKEAFVPAVFLLFVVTTIASLPVLRINDMNWVILMMTTIFFCFVWQLLMLHRLNRPGATVSDVSKGSSGGNTSNQTENKDQPAEKRDQQTENKDQPTEKKDQPMENKDRDS